MARGWESKEIESQIETAERLRETRQQQKIDSSRIELERAIESLELSRSRVLDDLSAASNPNYRNILSRSLEFLDTKLAKLRGV